MRGVGAPNPVQLSSGSVHESSSSSPSTDIHVFTPEELASSQGWPAFPQDPLRACQHLGLEAFSLRAQEVRLGQGMHLAAEEAWLVYILAHTVRRDALEHIAPPWAPAVVQLPREQHEGAGSSAASLS